MHNLPLGPLEATALHRLPAQRHPLKLSRRELIRHRRDLLGQPVFALERLDCL
jgi:hypothetical protein